MDSFGISFFENKQIPQTCHVEMRFYGELESIILLGRFPCLDVEFCVIAARCQ